MMRGILLTLFATLAMSPAARAEEAPRPIEVMVLGSYHMDNPGLDIAKVTVDDVTTPQRQRELAALADALAAWKPTKVLVEAQRPAPFALESYPRFSPEMLKTDRNEIVQIGFRLAHQLHLPAVYGFDEQPTGDEPDYFPFDKVMSWAEAHGRKADVEAMIAFYQSRAEALVAKQKELSIAQALMLYNEPAAMAEDHRRGYLGLLSFGDGEHQPGADLNAMWYLRNLKMFAKIGLIAQPGDRVLVLVGAGHGYWLKQLASETPGFVNVDPVPVLAKVK
jgi:hypothetical protein